MSTNLKIENSPISNFYNGKTVLLTGATGFMGQLYLEKLLKINAKCVYILLRIKKGMTPLERLEKLLTSPVFDVLKKHNIQFKNRIVPIVGSMEEGELGISAENQILLKENVEIVFHAAADVRFDISLLELSLVNLRGTRDLIKLSKEMKKLQIFVYISTAYSHCPSLKIDEKFYKPPIIPDKMIELAENLKSAKYKIINEILTAKFIWPWPNTYTFTKALSEELVREFGAHCPVTVVRPSIIISTHSDPIPGWFNNLNGFSGLFFAVAMGFLRIIPVIKENSRIDLICADVVSNLTFAATYDTFKKNEHEKKVNNCLVAPQIYNATTGSLNPITIKRILNKLISFRDVYTPSSALWYPVCYLGTNKLQILYVVFCLELLPALFFDSIVNLFVKTKHRLIPLYRKVTQFEDMILFFQKNEWDFDVTNILEVYNSMTASDKLLFPCDIRTISWDDIIEVYFQGATKYVFPGKDIDNREEKSRKHVKKLKIYHYTLLTFIYVGLILSLGFLTYNYLCKEYNFF